eukprot:1157111-Pelagomonas_calceolata.AAC.2
MEACCLEAGNTGQGKGLCHRLWLYMQNKNILEGQRESRKTANSSAHKEKERKRQGYLAKLAQEGILAEA